jgi:hypothetical protein
MILLLIMQPAKTGSVSSSKLTISHMWGSDYNLETNIDSFKDDFLNRFRNYLDEVSIIIINSATYHSNITVRVPNTEFYTRDITQWLQKNYIEYNPTVTIPELLLLILTHKCIEKVYELDQTRNEMGHLISRLLSLRLSVYLNWIDMDKVKEEVTQISNIFILSNTERLINKAINRVTMD